MYLLIQLLAFILYFGIELTLIVILLSAITTGMAMEQIWMTYNVRSPDQACSTAKYWLMAKKISLIVQSAFITYLLVEIRLYYAQRCYKPLRPNTPNSLLRLCG
jgi:uncharacterized membrane-anchored protein